jgi:hypothetical protein
VQRAADVGRVVSRKHDAQRVGRAACRPRGEHALDRRLAFRILNLQCLTLLGYTGGRGAHRARFGGEPRERAVRVGDRALGVAQRVARLALRRLAAPDFLVQLVDTPAQRLELVFLRRSPGRNRGQRERDTRGAAQTFILPCAATEAVRRATSSGSPR